MIGITGVSGTNIASTYDEYGLPIYMDESTGSIDVTAEGNASPFTFLWSTGATSEDLTGVPAGTYTVTITNAFGCTKVLKAIIEGCDKGGIDRVEYKIVPATADDPYSAGINLEITGNWAVPNLYFKWVDMQNGSVISTSEDLEHVGAGDYCVFITGNGCIGEKLCINIPRCPYALPGGAFHLTFAPDPVPCFKMSNGGIDLSVSGVPEPYSYKWSNGTSTQDLLNIPAGTWKVKVTDGNGCVYSEAYTLKSKIEDIALMDIQHSCSAPPSGSLNIAPQPTGEYNYLWSNGVTGSGPGHQLTGLSPGEYCVTVTEPISGCTITKCWKILDHLPAEAIQVNYFANTQCAYSYSNYTDQCKGTIQLSMNEALAGSDFYLYSFTGSDFTRLTADGEVSGLCIGDYSVVVTDQSGCSAEMDFSICCCPGDNVTEITCFYDGTVEDYYRFIVLKNINVIQPSIENNLSGSISVGAGYGWNGTGTHHSTKYYSWEKEDDPGFQATTAAITGLDAGVYCVTVTDGCASTSSCFIIGNYSSSTTVKPSCPEGDNGAITVTFGNDTRSPYRVEWSTGIETGITGETFKISDLAPGHYIITITDAENFTYYAEGTVVEEISNEAYGWPVYLGNFSPFEIEDNCIEDGVLWPIFHKPRISVRKDCNNDQPENTDTFSWTVIWPNHNASFLSLTGENECDVLHGHGIDTYEVDENTNPGNLTVSLVDNRGCKKEYCFSFGLETGAPTPAANNITPLGVPYSLSAITGYYCINHCGTPCEGADPYFGHSITGYSNFEFTPNDPSFPCTSGGSLEVKCDGYEQILDIPSYLYGQEFIDWENPITVRPGVCGYNVGCLFEELPANSIENEKFFKPFLGQGIPLYVTTIIEQDDPDCQEPIEQEYGCTIDYPECTGGVTYITDGTNQCRGMVVCNATQLVIATNVYFEECITICYEQSGIPGRCNEKGICEISGDLIYMNEISCPEEPLDPKTLCPGIAKPGHESGERSDDMLDNVSDTWNDVEVYPNPFQDDYVIFIKSTENGIANLSVTDIAGRMIHNESIPANRGNNILKIKQQSGLAAGIYLVKVTMPDGKTVVKRIVKGR